MTTKLIVSIRTGWGTLDTDTWKRIHGILARGEAVGLWNGRHRDTPSWAIGKCSLRVKVGKKRKLVKGYLTHNYEGFDDGGESYSIDFTPNRPRVFK